MQLIYTFLALLGGFLVIGTIAAVRIDRRPEKHEDETEDYVYFTTASKSEEAFYLVQYVCGEADYESYQPQFLSWAEQSGFEE